MNSNQKQFVYLKIKRFINKQPKNVQHTLPHAVERKINLEDDLKILKDWNFKDFKPRESFIIGECFDIQRKNKIFFTKSKELLKLVSSDNWRKFSSLRVTEGCLYDMILFTLNYLVKKQSVKKFDLIGFDEESSKENKPKQPSENTDLVRTKITFTYYNRVDKSIMDVLENDGWNLNLIHPSLTQSQTYVKIIHTSDQSGFCNMEIVNKNDKRCLSATNIFQHLDSNKQSAQLALDSNGTHKLHLEVFTNQNRENQLTTKVPKSETRFSKIKHTTDKTPENNLKVADSWPTLDIDLLTEDKFSKSHNNQPLAKKLILPLNLVNIKYNLSDQNKPLDTVENAVCFYSKMKSFNYNCEHQDNIDFLQKYEQTSICDEVSPDLIAENSETQRINYSSLKSNMAARKSSHAAARASSAKGRPVTAVASGSTAMDRSSVPAQKPQERPQTAPVAATKRAARRLAVRRDARCTAFCSDMQRVTSLVRRQAQLNTKSSDRPVTSPETSRPDKANCITSRLDQVNPITGRPDQTRSSAVQKLCEAARMRKFRRVLTKRNRLRPDDWKLISDAEITFTPSLNVRYSIDRMRTLTSERDCKVKREYRDADYYLTQSPSSRTLQEQDPNHEISTPHLQETDVQKQTRHYKSSATSKDVSLTLKQSDDATQLSDYKKCSVGRSREKKPAKIGDPIVNMFTGDTSGVRGIIGLSLPAPGFVQDILTILDGFVLRVEKLQAQGTKEANRRIVRSITINRSYTTPD